MSDRKKKPHAEPIPEPIQKPISFGAYPDEIKRWKEKASRVDRTLSWWIRNRLLLLDARDEENATRISERADGDRELVR